MERPTRVYSLHKSVFLVRHPVILPSILVHHFAGAGASPITIPFLNLKFSFVSKHLLEPSIVRLSERPWHVSLDVLEYTRWHNLVNGWFGKCRGEVQYAEVDE